MELLHRLQRIDRRYIFVCIGLAVLVPFLTGLKLPLGAISPPTQDLYNLMESLPERTPIIIAFDYGPASMPELHPMALALIRQAFKKNLRILAMSLNTQGVPLADDVLGKAGKEASKVEGTDWVNLGFKPGGNAVILGMGLDIAKVYATVKDKPTAGIPVMQGIRNFSQIGVSPHVYLKLLFAV